MNKLTVYFEEPFWVGVFERVENGKLMTSRVVFGSEPKDYEIYEFILKNYSRLKFSKPVKGYKLKRNRINPKRLQRKIRKEIQIRGISTKAQEAIRLEREANKLERKKKSKKQKEEEKRLKFLKKQQKKKEKKKGH
ncbi:Protein of unknown function [Caminicella sporogenes DSM 14501]|uniref:DUF2992 family protein n=1 Tax=Caminicella sporogenes DSM 14501 TaxID=1121266 RepID=A0A1M6TRE4_9FIRM|nr:YjdF family protein [Caminicella sporogenes]RKD24750.1 hypothetical protein BET04_11915 [Caminicella sporogenes]SHK59507.1 Protein of unknown function [Caminicella sporogenes DSM 14501]